MTTSAPRLPETLPSSPALAAPTHSERGERKRERVQRHSSHAPNPPAADPPRCRPPPPTHTHTSIVPELALLPKLVRPALEVVQLLGSHRGPSTTVKDGHEVPLRYDRGLQLVRLVNVGIGTCQ